MDFHTVSSKATAGLQRQIRRLQAAVAVCDGYIAELVNERGQLEDSGDLDEVLIFFDLDCEIGRLSAERSHQQKIISILVDELAELASGFDEDED
jgi:hypothetical protein